MGVKGNEGKARLVPREGGRVISMYQRECGVEWMKSSPFPDLSKEEDKLTLLPDFLFPFGGIFYIFFFFLVEFSKHRHQLHPRL